MINITENQYENLELLYHAMVQFELQNIVDKKIFQGFDRLMKQAKTTISEIDSQRSANQHNKKEVKKNEFNSTRN